MKLFDENGKQIFVYSVSSGSYEDESTWEFYSYRLISRDEFDAVIQEHEKLSHEYNKACMEIGKACGYLDANGHINVANIRETMKLYTDQVKQANLEYPDYIVDFIAEKLNLTPLPITDHINC